MVAFLPFATRFFVFCYCKYFSFSFIFYSIKHFTLYLYLLQYVAFIQMNTPRGTAETLGEILGSDFVSSG